jgi:hypothetical protein
MAHIGVVASARHVPSHRLGPDESRPDARAQHFVSRPARLPSAHAGRRRAPLGYGVTRAA